MGPYYQNTAQTTGAFFEMFYEQPIMMGLFSISVIGVGIFLWFRFFKNKK
jgi:hypothetical protein